MEVVMVPLKVVQSIPWFMVDTAGVIGGVPPKTLFGAGATQCTIEEFQYIHSNGF